MEALQELGHLVVGQHRGRQEHPDALGEPGAVVGLHAGQAVEHGAVGQSLANLLTFPFVREAVERGELNMDGAWFSIGRGELHWRDPASGAFSVVSAESDTVDRGEGI